MPTPAEPRLVNIDNWPAIRPDGPRFGFVLAWYDFWVGLFWSRDSRKLYVLPVPCVGFWVRL